MSKTLKDRPMPRKDADPISKPKRNPRPNRSHLNQKLHSFDFDEELDNLDDLDDLPTFEKM